MKTYLMTPGPTEVPVETQLEIARPVFHHRTPRFTEVLRETTELLRYVLRTSGEAFVLAGSGTAAMEACVVNTLNQGDKAICVRGGKFGQRWTQICHTHGVKPVNLDIEWGTAAAPDVIGKMLADAPDIKAVCVQLCETSTATVTDVEAIGRITRDSNALLIVDGVSAVGAVEYRMDEWCVDMTAVGSQKALMMPPGLAVVAASERAMERVHATMTPAYYLCLASASKAAAKSSTPYTPAVTLVMGLLASLRRIKEEGIENVWARHAKLGKALRAGARALGLGLLSRSPSDSVTAVTLPEGVDGKALLNDIESRHGVKFAGGQEQLAGRIVRISTMGYCGPFDVIIALAALEMGLREAGATVELGAGVRAAEEVLLKGEA
jgi:aspartate aminotransferase-like enzyme